MSPSDLGSFVILNTVFIAFTSMSFFLIVGVTSVGAPCSRDLGFRASFFRDWKLLPRGVDVNLTALDFSRYFLSLTVEDRLSQTNIFLI
ncbi:MAG: hypothetical protein PVG26_15430 [Desulfobacterales bacterium]